MGAMGLIVIIKALAGGANAAATALTVWSGIDWVARRGIDLKASKDLADMISFENVAGDLVPYDSAVKEYISGYQDKLDQVILTDEYRKEFLDTFYMVHPEYLVCCEKTNEFLSLYLDRLEAVLQKKITLGENFIIQGQSELKKMDQELMAKQDYTIQIIRELISELKQSKQRDDSASASLPSRSSNLESLSFYKIRRLTDNLWVNWETGRLGEDFDSVQKKAEDINGDMNDNTDAYVGDRAERGTDSDVDDSAYGDTDADADGSAYGGAGADVDDSADRGTDADAYDSTEKGGRRLSPSQVRLLSVLVQGEGAVVSWKDIFWRGKLTDRFLENYSIDDLSRTVYEYIRSRRGDDSVEGVYDLLNDDPAKIIFEYLASAICGSFRSSGKKEDVNLLQQEASYTFNALRQGSYAFPDEIIRTAAQAAINDLREADTALSNVIVQDKYEKGYRIILQEEDEDGGFPDLFEEYEGCSPDEDWPAKAIPADGKKDSEQLLPLFKDAAAWLRRYYNQACRSFDSKITNAAEENRNRNGTIFGNYTMSQAYMAPYVGKITANTDRHESLLDHVEDWYLGRDDKLESNNEKRKYGRVMVLHGQPGDGKTTFCKKIVYAHSREGWLMEAPHVLWFSLNPAASDIVAANKLDLEAVLCLKDDKGNKYFFNSETVIEGYSQEEGLSGDRGTFRARTPKKRKAQRKAKALCGALVILDAYDELKGAIANDDEVNSFSAFYDKVQIFAENHDWNVIITSRSRCIEEALKSEALRYADVSDVSFAPMEQEQQEAMLDRMIELDLERGKKEYGKEERGSQVHGRQGHEVSLTQYKAYLQELWEKEDTDGQTKDFKALLKVPILFRMIVARRFMELSETETVTELYGRLFHSLLSYKREETKKDKKENKNIEAEVTTEDRGTAAKSHDEKKIVKKYEEIAAGIFSYDRSTCAFQANDQMDESLVYLFYTKGESGRIGFLHASFYQYFLARYIVNAIRESMDFLKLFAVMRAEKLTDPDFWKMVTQLTELERDDEHYTKNNHYMLFHNREAKIQATHIKKVLGCLDDEELLAKGIVEGDPYERADFVPKTNEGRKKRDRLQEAENAVFNLICAFTAVENGLKPDDRKSIVYADFANVCGLLRRGDYSGIYMEGVNLDNCHLENARLRNARLAGAHFNHAELTEADLSGANLAGAFLQHANIKGANLAKAKLDRAHLEFVMANELSEMARYHSVSSNNVSSNDASSNDESSDAPAVSDAGVFNVPGFAVDLGVPSFADVFGWSAAVSSSSLHDGASFAGASLKEAHFDGAYLGGTVFDGADLRKAHFEKAILPGASLVGADLREAWFNDEAGVRGPEPDTGAIMFRVNVSGANLENARMEGVNLVMANLENALIAGAILKKARMDRANLTYASLEGADLREAVLTDARLDEAYLKRARIDIDNTLEGLKGASLRAACFDKEQVKYAANIGITGLEKRIRRGGMRTSVSHGEDKEIHVGDTIEFGRYPQEHKTDTGLFIPEPLRWRVLHADSENGRALVITERLIDCVKYHNVYEDITWEYCTLRKWMNTVFIRDAFTTEELSRITWVWNENEDITDGWLGKNVEGGNATRDRIFALSIEQVKDYFAGRMDRRAAVTPYARNRGSFEMDEYKNIEGKASGWWWLRSPGIFSHYAANVDTDGGVLGYGDLVGRTGGSVRPALWLNL